MGIVRATLWQTMFGVQIKNVLHFERADISNALMPDMANRIRDNWVMNVRNQQSGQLVYTRIDLVGVGSVSNLVPVTLGVNIQGTFFSDVRIFNPCSFVMQLRTGVGGPAGRGRQYIAGCYPNDLDKNLWTPAQMTRMQSLADTLKANFTNSPHSQPFNLVLTSKANPDADVKNITDIVPRTYPGSQVRRNFFRGS